ncbi:MAG TPA: ParB/RepB/Spo0J family partition protein [Tenuifilaceae bacterium]|nr:ParB/RepB/Spo0J family partition protein [Tenuifilaceae bacterium]HPE18448.1 ParB/RepB/Spo0J family partition protein [Tenuifilaceae bacterium]HPJ45657.1 ParB/RepB/Spo0J family partition protein [Tenuifilaceae bacterium]HPQ34177.1 ParB/RepB/Spo0J family partition protein [Tenuifilaceae bacterium]HRX67247.1 ParB/RepB/Spo0J family partition protein [Tenuifilaceae bacterium]
MVKKMALGRGLGALIEDADSPQFKEDKAAGKEATNELVSEIDINKIEANPYQPRSTFDEEALAELSESISKLGIIQPLTIRLVNGSYQLISGERRLRAAKMAGLKTVPAYVRTANDQGMLEMALVENIQRENLDAIEVAISFQRLVDECNLTHETLSERVGKKRTTITNYIRLLKLPAEIQLGIKEKKITMGHARTLVSFDDSITQVKLFRKIIDNDLSVRRTEELARKYSQKPEEKVDDLQEPEQEQTSENVVVDEFKQRLSRIFGWGAEVKPGNKGNGKIIISYRSSGELDEIMEKFNRLEE